jgi:hypothetical protein
MSHAGPPFPSCSSVSLTVRYRHAGQEGL